ncbi:hypothetical protein PGH12_05365 [Chryseobacterium wangxinyae]|uniref:hypothetical protein n=1 Tax=Chryseobacterium sp. CY350 TaxID=2997336 RepID=UPI00226E1DCD|nr:hypothetical protein [Chryseobacterium sp. CY350]MCY0976577.1 hypothetical protein [Chryseobacterium sp. CY350]WBZ96578.1 hypothetical protein PGH12_05365 [Chryseobacterium sp. CY350]
MKFKEKYIQILLVIITFVMTIFRFLLNEIGRVSPDSIRFMRFSKVLPVIDNTITPLGYPSSIHFFTWFGFDEFWSSKIVGITSYLFIIFFAWRKNFFFRESVIVCSLISFVSIFSATLSESFILPFILLLFYVAHQIISEKLIKWKACFYLTIVLIFLYNIRYSALFLIGGTGLYGLIFFRKKYASTFILSSLAAFAFVVLYKFLFIDYFNENYVQQSLEIGLKPTSILVSELFQGLATSFNPFLHMANPGGGKINFVIYGIGILNVLLIVFLFIKNKLSPTEKYMIMIGISGIVCTFFVQYFYWIDPLDYRLLSPFSFPIWLVYFKKLFETFRLKTYSVAALSLLSGIVFMWLSKGNYLENRKEIKRYLHSENLQNEELLFYVKDMEDLDKVQIAELVSSVNANISFTSKADDTLKKTTLTAHKVLQKIKIDKNKYQ